MFKLYGEKNSEVKEIGEFENQIEAVEFAQAVEKNTKQIKIKCWVVEA